MAAAAALVIGNEDIAAVLLLIGAWLSHSALHAAWRAAIVAFLADLLALAIAAGLSSITVRRQVGTISVEAACLALQGGAPISRIGSPGPKVVALAHRSLNGIVQRLSLIHI